MRHNTAFIVGLCGILVVTSVLEGIGIGIVLPLFDFIQNANAHNKYQEALQYLGLSNLDRASIVLTLCVIVGVVFVIKNSMRVAKSWANAYFVNKIRAEWQEDIFNGYLHSSYQYFVENKQGILVQNLLNQTTQCSNAINVLIETVAAVLVGVAIYVVLIVSSLKITVLLTFFSLFVGLGSYHISRRSCYAMGSKLVKIDQATYSTVLETIAGIRQVKAFAAEKFFRGLFEKFIRDRLHLQVRYTVLNQFPSPVIEALVIGGICIGLGLLAKADLKNVQNAIPVIALFVVAAYRLMPLIANTSSYVMQIGQFLPSIAVVADLLSAMPKANYSSALQANVHFRREIALRDVSFQYPGGSGKTLSKVSMVFPKGTFAAIVGPSGAGKSTLFDLLIRFYEPTSGKITIDGKNINQYEISFWRRLIGFASQDTFIFNGTIRENITFASEESDTSRMERSAKFADAHEFIANLPDGYETQVGDRGMKLSGGQRQRLAISRALYRDPSVIILDEATSSLDSESEREVQLAIERLGGNKTVIVIAHRLSTVINADRIYVLVDGKIVEEGTHKSLLDRRGAYWKLCQQQDLSENSTLASS